MLRILPSLPISIARSVRRVTSSARKVHYDYRCASNGTPIRTYSGPRSISIVYLPGLSCTWAMPAQTKWSNQNAVRDKKSGQPLPFRIHLKDSARKPQPAGELP